MSFTEPIIDLHVHTAGIGAGASDCYVSPALRNNWRYTIYLSSFGVSHEELIQYGDIYAIDKLAELLTASTHVDGAVILALDGVISHGDLDLQRTEVYIPTEFVAAAVQHHPHLYYGASINPHRLDALDLLDQAKSSGAILVKWLPNIQGISPDDSSLKTYYQKLVDLDLPLLTHVGEEHSFSRSDNSLGAPHKLHLPLGMGVRVIAAHVGYSASRRGRRNTEELLQMISQYDNLYADISSLTQINKHFALKKILKADVNHRLLYGSDMPLINTALVSPWHYTLEVPWERLRHIVSHKNPWDRDVLLKQALGLPNEVFTRVARFLTI